MTGAEPTGIERELAARIAASGVRLRFDRVVLRLVERLRASLADDVPAGQAVLFACTAPVRLPGKTAVALDGLARGGLPGRGLIERVHGNCVGLRRVVGVPAGLPKVFGFVHNPDADIGLILDLAEACLLETGPPSGRRTRAVVSGRQ